MLLAAKELSTSPKRLGQRRRMTLIAAFKCSDGAVICADSQETIGSYRRSVQKIEPMDCGNFQIAIGGSGENGDLIDGFVQRIKTNIQQAAIDTLSELEIKIHSELLDYRNNEISSYRPKERRMELIICCRSLKSIGYSLWRTKGARLVAIQQYELVGWDEYRYYDIVSRLYSQTMPMTQGVLLGLHLFTVAEETSIYIKKPITIVLADGAGIWSEKSEFIKEMEKSVAEFSRTLDSLTLACPDVSISLEQFKEKLAQFEEKALKLRADYLQAIADQILRVGSPNQGYSNPVVRLAPAQFVGIIGNRVIFIEDEKKAIFYKKWAEDIVAAIKAKKVQEAKSDT